LNISQRNYLIIVFGLITLILFSSAGQADKYGLTQPGPGLIEVNFSYEPMITVDQVYLAGEFNEWDPEGTKMIEEDGVYEKTIYLKPGEYEYKFVVDGENWIRPEDADDYAPDGFGGENAVIFVEEEPSLFDFPEKGDGEITYEAVAHDQGEHRYFDPYSTTKLSLHLETNPREIEQVKIRLLAEEKEEVYSMDRFLTLSSREYFRKTIELPEPNFEYHFILEDGEQTYYFGAGEIAESLSGVENFAAELEQKEIFRPPAWAQKAVFYQIFPDRFAKATNDNNPQKIEVYKDDTALHEAYIPDWEQGIKDFSDPVIETEEHLLNNDNLIETPAGYHAFYGGDLRGVKEKIDYLEQLGITAIYFNPIHDATANHRYNARNFKKIDDRLAFKGDQKRSWSFFEELVAELADSDIKVVLDGVFNHVGYDHWAFQDVVEQGEDSEYVDWFFIHDFPVRTLYQQEQEDIDPNYDGWWGFGHMPELNLENPEVRDYIWAATEKWMETGIDGWRLDVPQDAAATDPNFWPEWREHVKQIDESAYLTGEIWGNAADYLQGDEFDAVMNYRFRDAVINFIGQGNYTADDFHREMMRLFVDYPDRAVYSLQNLLGSHDTIRYLTLIDEHKERFRLSKFLQFTYVGAPMIYYGDEVGMKGGEDPDNRRTMLWSDRGYTAPDQELKDYVRHLIELRASNPALQKGDISHIETKPDMVYGFVRNHEGESRLVLLNAAESEARLQLHKEDLPWTGRENYRDLYRDEEIKSPGDKLEINLEPFSGRVIK